MKPLRILLFSATLLTMSAAQAATRIYDVDPLYRQEVYELLRELLGVYEGQFANMYGQVQILPTGQLLVDTVTDERQEEVAAVLAAIAERSPGETPIVTLRYWVLAGYPDVPDADNLPPVLESVYRELEEAHGPLGFEVLDAATVTGRSGEEAVMQSERWEIYQLAQATDDRVNARIAIEHVRQELSVEVALQRGQFLVLGASTTDQGGGTIQALIVNWP